MREPGVVRDQLWLIPYKQHEMVNLSIPSTISFPVRSMDNNNENILVLDNSATLWSFRNISQGDIEIKRATKTKIKQFK